MILVINNREIISDYNLKLQYNDLNKYLFIITFVIISDEDEIIAN